jgi:hypothetical protein
VFCFVLFFKILAFRAKMLLFGFDVARLSGVGLWVLFWFFANFVCYWFVGAFVTRSKERGRLALRAVSIVHAIMVIPELSQTITFWNEGTEQNKKKKKKKVDMFEQDCYGLLQFTALLSTQRVSCGTRWRRGTTSGI